MFFIQSTLLALSTLATFTSADKAGYHLPTSGTASTTQFYVGPELGGGTSCGASAFPNGKKPSGKQGGGPGYLYAAINQLAFGANPSVNGAGGPGAACGLCYKLTPVSSHGTTLTDQALSFMIVDECPASPAASGARHCTQCHTSGVNDYGQHWHFDIAVDAMSTAQYDRFFNGVTDGSNWREIKFQEVTCSGATNPDPHVHNWGCLQDCHNNEKADVCQGVQF